MYQSVRLSLVITTRYTRKTATDSLYPIPRSPLLIKYTEEKQHGLIPKCPIIIREVHPLNPGDP